MPIISTPLCRTSTFSAPACANAPDENGSNLQQHVSDYRYIIYTRSHEGKRRTILSVYIAARDATFLADPWRSTVCVHIAHPEWCWIRRLWIDAGSIRKKRVAAVYIIDCLLARSLAHRWNCSSRHRALLLQSLRRLFLFRAPVARLWWYSSGGLSEASLRNAHTLQTLKETSPKESAVWCSNK